MAQGSPKLEWLTVRLGRDMNWWVEKTSDPVNWDTIDGLSILDPRQVAYIIDASDQLMEYGLQPSVINDAFYKFHVVKDLGKGRISLERVQDSLLETTEPLFALPDIVDEEKGPYADLINQLTQARVKMLNDLIDFEQRLTIEELEDEIREHQNNEYMEGKAIHAFAELTSILEYVPQGYELELGEEEEIASEEEMEGVGLDEEFPDLEEEDLEQDETMRWGDTEEDFDEDEYEEDEDEEEDDQEDEDDFPKRARGKRRR